MILASNGIIAGKGLAPIVTSGLILLLDAGNSASYPGTGTIWTDLSGQNNNGTLLNGVGYSSSNGGVLTFDGVNDLISSFPSAFPNQTTKTLDIWFRSTSNVRQGLISNRQGSTGWVLVINKDASGRLEYYHTAGGSLLEINVISINNWYNVVLTYDATNLSTKLFLNGVNIKTGTLNLPVSSTFNGAIGNEQNIVSSPFKGDLPIVRIYNRVLSTAEITQNFDITKTRFGL